MRERIFNLFLEIKDDMIFELGAIRHEKEGKDEAKLAFLQQEIRNDLRTAKRYPIPKRYWIIDTITGHSTSALRYETYIKLSQLGRHLEVFEEVFEDLKSPPNPLVAITPIVDGNPRIDVVAQF
jgi:hypothetical protein